MLGGRVVNCSIFAGNLNANQRQLITRMDFRPSVQITGDLSGGKRKNGMMAGRLGDGDGTHHISTVAASVKKKTKKKREGKKIILCKQEQMTPLQLHLSGAPQSNRSLRQPSDAPSLFLLHSKMIFSLFFFLHPPSISLSPILPFILKLFPSCTPLKQFAGENVYLICDKMTFCFSVRWSGGEKGERRHERKEARGGETEGNERVGRKEARKEEGTERTRGNE